MNEICPFTKTLFNFFDAGQKYKMELTDSSIEKDLETIRGKTGIQLKGSTSIENIRN